MDISLLLTKQSANRVWEIWQRFGSLLSTKPKVGEPLGHQMSRNPTLVSTSRSNLWKLWFKTSGGLTVLQFCTGTNIPTCQNTELPKHGPLFICHMASWTEDIFLHYKNSQGQQMFSNLTTEVLKWDKTKVLNIGVALFWYCGTASAVLASKPSWWHLVSLPLRT